MALNLDPEFVRHIQGIYGDTNLDGRTIKQLYQIWQTNPQFIKNAYNQKNQPKTVTQSKPQLAPKAQLNPGQINRPEVANDDLSGISNFNDAFKVARQKGLKQFKWKSTKGNPSGLFGIQLATQKKPIQSKPVADQSKTPKKAEEEKSTSQPVSENKANTETTKPENSQSQPTPIVSRTPDKLNSFVSRANSNFVGPRNITTSTVFGGKVPQEPSTLYKPGIKNIDTDFTPRTFYPTQHIPYRTASMLLRRNMPEQSIIDAGLGGGQPSKSEYRNYIMQHNITPTAEQSQNSWDWVMRGQSIRPNIFQQGGTMQQSSQDEEIKKAFIQFLVQDAAAQGVQIQSEQDLQKYAQQLGEKGIQAKYQEFIQRMQGGVKAKLGSKLTYLKKLKRNK